MSFQLERHGLDRRVIDILEDKGINNLRHIQAKALREGVLTGRNLFIAAPSGSGKTFIGEVAALQNILQNKTKSVFLVPLRALASEKYDDFVAAYSKLGIKIALRTGDVDIQKVELERADLIIATYERFDSLLRNKINWLSTIGTVVVDEIHIINDPSRGPRLENLLARLRKYLPRAQLVALSATIANPEDLAGWLGCKLIKSVHRPVELKYEFICTPDKVKTINELVVHTIKDGGQLLIFTMTRKEARLLARDLVKMMIDGKLLDARERVELDQFFKSQDLTKMAKFDRSLLSMMKYGAAYHNAGLSSDTRKLVEENFRKRLVKVIACTTTLAAGVNLPAKVVILKDSRLITTDPNIMTTDDTYFWKYQLDSNLFHQILGRAGRPGLDEVGVGVILAPSKADMKRLISQYFHFERGKVRPKYEKVQSQLNQREMLYEQVLVRLNENGGMTSASILDEFKNTYWWYLIQKEAPEKSIDQLIEIGAVSIQKALRDLTNEKTRMQSAHIADDQVKITKAENKVLQGIITDTISQTCALYRDYPSCTCREFKFSEETNEIILCRHLIKLIEVGLKKYPRLTNDLACLALQREYILDSLLKMDMVKAVGDDYYITELGKLTAELLIKPSTAIVIKARLSTIETLSDLLETIQKLHVVELERYLDDMFVQIMLELINRPDGTDLAFKMLEASEKYLRGVGDIEEYVQFARRMARTIAKFSQLYDFKNGLTHSLHIEKKLYE